MEETYILEINLISAQGLKLPSTNLRRMQTYALAWVDSTVKLRTRIDRIGGENPTWNDKFFFRVTSDFISNENSAVSVEIYSVGYLKDPLIGTVRFLIGNCLSSTGFCSPASTGVNFGIPSFSALQIRRPSGRFHGVLNIGSMVINGSDFSVLTGLSAIGYRDLMGENNRKPPKSRRKTMSRESFTDENSCGNSSCGDTGDYSDADSSCSSTTTTTSTVLKELNGRRDVTMISRNQSFDGTGSGFMCGLGFQRNLSSESVRSEIAD